MTQVLASVESEADEAQTVPSKTKPSRAGRWRSWWAARTPSILAVLTALMGLLNVWSAVTPGLHDRMRILWDVLPFEVRRGSHLTAALAGFALGLLSLGLARRKSVAWALALAALLTSAIAHGLKGLDYEEATCALLLAAWLWASRPHFHARSDAPSVRRGLQVLAAAFAFTLFYGALGFYLLDAHFKVRFSVGAALAQTVTMFTQFYDPGLQPATRFGARFADSIYIVAAGTFAYAATQLARPVLSRHAPAASDFERARGIVERYGRTAFAFCALLGDKTFWFSPGGSVVPYALVGRVAVAMGDPIGPSQDQGPSIAGFCAFCRGNDWRPAFYEVYEDNLPAHHEAGLEVLRIAHEAVLDLKAWSLDGKTGKNARNILNSMRKGGYEARLHLPPLSPGLVGELREVSDQWLASVHGSEKGFSLGWFDAEAIHSQPVMAVHNPEGGVLAFANLVSCYTLNESTIDLMRRREEIPKSTMEFLFLSLFEWAKGQGFDTFNLGPSPFAMVGEHSEDPTAERAIHFLYEHVNQFYNFKGLHAFKEKFHPLWRPLYLSYEGRAGLPLVASAIVRADSGQPGWFAFLRSLRGEREGA